jgi:hypothetical protein
MKTPLYETSSGALLALLFATGPSARSFAYFDLYTITCVQGPVLKYTTCDRDVGYSPSNFWAANTVRIGSPSQQGALFHAKVGLDVDIWQALFMPRAADDISGAAYPDLIGSTPWLAAAAAGALDGASVTVDRAYFAVPMPPPQALPLSPLGVLRLFAGRVAEVDLGRTAASLTINSHLELLNVQIPRNLFQAGCRHRLYDAGCTLNAADFASGGTCTAGSSRFQLISTIPAPIGSGTFTLGRVMMTSGLNAGFSRAVRSWAVGVNIYFVAPLPFNVAIGDTFLAYAGCDKALATCDLFANRLNFGGEPFIPSPETAA